MRTNLKSIWETGNFVFMHIHLREKKKDESFPDVGGQGQKIQLLSITREAGESVLTEPLHI